MKKNKFLKGLIGIGIYLFIFFFASPILVAIGLKVENLSKLSALFVEISLYLIIIGTLFLLFKDDLKKDFNNYTRNFKNLFKRNAKYWGCALLVMYVSNFAIAIIFNKTTSANNEGIMQLFDIYPVYTIIQTILIAPFIEELVFRKSIRTMIKNNYLFLIISSTVFGFMHILASMASIADILYIIPYSAPGFFFAYMLYKEDNIFVPITFHMLHNTLAMIALIIIKLTGIM